MVAYVIADIDVVDAERYGTYKQLVPPAIVKHGGRYLARGGHMAVLEGRWKPNRVVILEFPSLDQAKAFYASVEYTATRRARGNSARMNMVVVEGA